MQVAGGMPVLGLIDLQVDFDLGVSRRRNMVLLEQDVGFEVVGLGIEKNDWEMCFACSGLWVIFLSEDSVEEVGVEEVVDCSLTVLSRPWLW